MEKRVLIVDDKQENREVLKNFFNFFGIDSGINLFFAETSSQALQIISEQPIDLILLDIFIEQRDSGILIVKKIRNELKNNNVNIWAITAQAMKSIDNNESDEERCLKAGCNMYFSKPIDQKRLLMETSKLFNLEIPIFIKKKMGIP